MNIRLAQAFLSLLMVGALAVSPVRAQAPELPSPTTEVGAPLTASATTVAVPLAAAPEATASPAAKPSPSPQMAADSNDATDLAKQSQNPVASLISLPFQSNTAFGVGEKGVTAGYLKIQPVIPQNVGEWNIIHRLIMPVAYLPYDALLPASMPGQGSGDFGLSDTTYSAFVSPAKPGKLIWGVGPAITLPTASHKTLGEGKWNLGPTAVFLTMEGPVVAGVLLQQQWSVAGDTRRPDVSAGLVQPFFNYNLPKGWYLTTSPIMNVNWNADRGQKWTVPVGGGVGRVFEIGKQPVNVSAALYYNAIRPVGAEPWVVRLAFTFLFPTAGK